MNLSMFFKYDFNKPPVLCGECGTPSLPNNDEEIVNDFFSRYCPVCDESFSDGSEGW